MYVNICKYKEYNIQENRHKISIQKGFEYKPTILDLIETFLFLRLKKLRFKHFKIHTKPSKHLRLTPLRTHFKRGICSKHAHAQAFFRAVVTMALASFVVDGTCYIIVYYAGEIRHSL